MAGATLPLIVVLISGKRKSGKDFVSEAIKDKLAPSAIFRISEPLKRAYATSHGLDINQLMGATPYKETHRKSMIEWGEKMRQNDHGYFCRLATEEFGHQYPIWIISDIRRQTDVSYFRSRHNCVLVRVSAPISVREKRGFIFSIGIDDSESECGLDTLECDVTIQNDGTLPLEEVAEFSHLVEQLKRHLS